MIEDFKKNMLVLKNYKEKLLELNKRFEEKHKVFEVENADLLNEILDSKKNLDSLDIQIRDNALVLLAQTGERKLPFGVEIKSVKSYDYDETEALAWAKKHDMALGLDKSAFKKIMKADPTAMDFVQKREKDTVYMPRIIKED